MMLINCKNITEQNVSEDTTHSNEVVDVPPAKKQKKIPKILDGVYYVIESIDNEKVAAKCQECDTIIKGSITSTGNFKSHYKKHTKEKKKLDEYLKQGHNTEIDENAQVKKQTQPRMEDMLAKMAPVSDEKVIF